VVGLIRGLLLGDINEEEHVDDMIKRSITWTERWDETRRMKWAQDDRRHGAEPRLERHELMRHLGGTIASLEDLDLDERGKSGYVYKSLRATVFLLRYAMRQLKDVGYSGFASMTGTGRLFEQSITDLTMEAGDADTNACSAGAVLGAYLGYCAIPQYWRDGLKYAKFLEHKTEGLCQDLGVSYGDYDGKKDPHTAQDGGNGFLVGIGRKRQRTADNARPSGKKVRHNDPV
jgi:hypothetical protein